MKRNFLFACVGLSFFWSSAHGESWDFSFTTVSAVANTDGSELVTTVLYEYSQGSPFLVEYHITSSGISTPGGGFIAPVSNFPVSGAPATGGSWGPGPFPGDGGGGPPGDLIIQGEHHSSSHFFDNQSILGSFDIDGSNEINAGPLVPAIGAVACVTNHITQLRALERACGEAGVKSMRTGVCGMGGSVRCNEPPPPPPPLPDTSLFWYHSMQMLWNPPFDWGWPSTGPFVITDGF